MEVRGNRGGGEEGVRQRDKRETETHGASIERML